MLSVVAAAIWYSLTDAGILAFALPGVFAPRFLGLRSGADIVCSITLLVAAWSNVFDLYTSISWWDVLIHVVCTAVLAAVVHAWAAHLGVVSAPRETSLSVTVMVTAAIGLALSALWEMVEWFGYVAITTDIYVTYHDTIGDMAAGGAGACAAGLLLRHMSLLRDQP
ncbi:hypothetical protein [Nesterenkonia flava]|uniref:DUF2238 domain-containing protein n=1 Tax=Nesterenkonia flava TaxID=469799 RepID=A0ABU1FS60_9MICC|nr:hypothetical protein [Nesterenkonia flava]MDR5711505.1 hypothetical protein [Nesterenkonia flava]